MIDRVVDLRKAEDRNTPSHWITLGTLRIFFSYRTALGFVYLGRKWFRDFDSNTSRKHLSKAGLRDGTRCTEAEFNYHLCTALRAEVVDMAGGLVQNLERQAKEEWETDERRKAEALAISEQHRKDRKEKNKAEKAAEKARTLKAQADLVKNAAAISPLHGKVAQMMCDDVDQEQIWERLMKEDFSFTYKRLLQITGDIAQLLPG